MPPPAVYRFGDKLVQQERDSGGLLVKFSFVIFRQITESTFKLDNMVEGHLKW